MPGKRTRGAGEGSIYQRANGQWVATIELPATDGKRRRRYVYGSTKPDLLEKIRDERKRFEVVGDMPTKTMTTGAWLTYWLEHVAAKEVRPITFATYRSAIVRHVIPEVGSVRLDRLTPTHVRQVHERILATPKDPNTPAKGTLSSTSALQAHRILSSALSAAEREGLIIRNPTGLVRAPRKAPTKLEVLDVPEALLVIRLAFDALDRASRGEPYDPYPMRWATALLTGARRGEVLGIELERVVGGKQPHIDLSWQLQRLKVGAGWPSDYEARPVKGGLWLTRPKSAAGTRIIPLVDPLKTALDAHMAAMPENTWGLLFAPRNLPIDPHKDSKQLAAVLEGLGIEKHVRVHDLRHTTVDLLYEAGVPEHIIMEVVGHSVRAVTRGYRSKGNHALLAAGMESLSALLNLPALRA